jgi:hypothetical protein
VINFRAAIGDPGSGEANIRVLLASIVGPLRIAHGIQQAHRLVRGRPIQVASNKSNAKQAAYCAVAVRQGQTGGAVAVLFDSGQSMGAAASMPALLAETSTAASLSPFSSVLLPNEQLYAQLVDTNFAEIDLVVSTVYV